MNANMKGYNHRNGATGSNVWRSPVMIASSVLTFVLSTCFFYWVNRQENLGKPCIFPLSIWKTRSFAALCLIVFLSYASFNAITYLCSLFFQDVQHLSAQQTSLRMLPDVVVGVIVNVAVGLLVDKLSAYWIVLGATALTMASSIILSIMKERWIYWAAAFPGVALSVISSDGTSHPSCFFDVMFLFLVPCLIIILRLIYSIIFRRRARDFVIFPCQNPRPRRRCFQYNLAARKLCRFSCRLAHRCRGKV